MLPIETVKKITEKIYKKNKTICIIFLCVLISSLIELAGGVVYKYINMVDIIQDSIVSHESKINNIREDVTRAETKGIVTRESFNQYIMRKDTEYHEQMSINNDVYNRLGFVEGVLKMRAIGANNE